MIADIMREKFEILPLQKSLFNAVKNVWLAELLCVWRGRGWGCGWPRPAPHLFTSSISKPGKNRIKTRKNLFYERV
jgi:hypothetical protein